MYTLQPEQPTTKVDPGKRITNIGCTSLLVIAILFAAASFLGILPKSKYQQFLDIERANGTAYTPTVDRSDACFMSQKFVKDRLKAPSTAEFPMWTEDNCKVDHNGGQWIVYSYVDAQNGFGAMIRSEYVVKMTYNSSRDVWTLTDFVMDSR